MSRQTRERRWLAWTVLSLLLVAAGRLPAGDNSVQERLKRDLTFLASDECEGRGIGTHGIDLAADYIARAFQEAGLKPAAPEGGYFQPFTIRDGSRLVGPN